MACLASASLWCASRIRRQEGRDFVAAVLSFLTADDGDEPVRPVGQEQLMALARKQLFAMEKGDARARNILEIDSIGRFRPPQTGKRRATSQRRRRAQIKSRKAPYISGDRRLRPRADEEIRPMIGQLDLARKVDDQFCSIKLMRQLTISASKATPARRSKNSRAGSISIALR